MDIYFLSEFDNPEMKLHLLQTKRTNKNKLYSTTENGVIFDSGY